MIQHNTNKNHRSFLGRNVQVDFKIYMEMLTVQNSQNYGKKEGKNWRTHNL